MEAYIKQKQHLDQGFKHFRVRQLLKEDAGSGVRADDSGVGVFIIFVNIMILAYSLTNTIVIIIISILTMTMTKVTPLHWAAINDRPDVVDLLLDCGADPNCKGSPLIVNSWVWIITTTIVDESRTPGGRLGGTPLHWAATRGATRVAVRWNNFFFPSIGL